MQQANAERAHRGKKDSGKSATLVPHGGKFAVRADDQHDVETIDLIEDGVVSRIFASWNQLDGWLRRVDALRRVA